MLTGRMAMRFGWMALLVVAVVLIAWKGMKMTQVNAQEKAPVPAVDETKAASSGHETAVFAGGCFWGTQAVFQRVKGVKSTMTGYAGGSATTATYAQVTTETTGHAESVKVVYDPSKLTYGQLLRIFFTVHDLS